MSEGSDVEMTPRRKVDVRNFNKPEEFNGDRRGWTHFEFVFSNWFCFLYDEADDWLKQAASVAEWSPVSSKAREADRALYMSLSQVCKGPALDVVRSVARNQGFLAWRLLNKEYGINQSTALTELGQLLNYDFGARDKFRQNLLRWENGIREYVGTTGEPFTDKMKCAVVLQKAPEEVKAYLRVQSKGDYSELRSSLMNYLEAVDDRVQVPMDVGFVGGKGKGKEKAKGKGKGDSRPKGKSKGKGHQQEWQSSFGGARGQQPKGGGKAPANSKFPGNCRACGRYGHKASECWQRSVGAIEPVWTAAPSSTSAPSVVAASSYSGKPSSSVAGVTSELHDGPWVFSLGRWDDDKTVIEEKWQEIVVDSGSVATACPYWFGADMPTDETQTVSLQDIQRNPIRSYGKRKVPVELEGYNGNVKAIIEFDVADVAYPVISVGKMANLGFVFSFTGRECYMARDGRRVQIRPRGATYVIRAKREWAGEVGCQTVAPISDGKRREGQREGETPESEKSPPLVDSMADGTGEEQENVQSSKPKEVRRCRAPPGSEAVRRHELVHCPYEDWCEICIQAKGKDNPKTSAAPESGEAKAAKVQMDYTFVTADGDHTDASSAKGTILTVVCVDTGMVASTVLRAKNDDYGVKFVKAVIDFNGLDVVDLKTDGETSIEQLAGKVKAARAPAETRLRTGGAYSHEDLGTVERMHQTVQGQLRAIRLDFEKRLGVKLIPGTLFFPWAARHAGWIVARYQPRSGSGQTSFEKVFGRKYDSPLVPFGETVMARVPHDTEIKRKLDSVWIKGCWVGRTEVSDEHIILTPKGVMRTRAVRRIPQKDPSELEWMNTLVGQPWDAYAGSARLLRSVRWGPGVLGYREPGCRHRPRAEAQEVEPPPQEPEESRDGASANEKASSSSGENPEKRSEAAVGKDDATSVGKADTKRKDGMPDAPDPRRRVSNEMCRQNDSVKEHVPEETKMDEVTESAKRPHDGRGPGGDRDGGPTRRRLNHKARVRARGEGDGTGSPDLAGEEPSRKVRRDTVAAIRHGILSSVSNDDGTEDGEQKAGNFEHVGGETAEALRGRDSVRKSRQTEIDKWMERGVVERWSRQAAMDTGVKIFKSRWVDDPYKEKSRFVICEYATGRDPSVFAAASDPSISRVVELKATTHKYPTFVFDVTSAYTHAVEDELCFFEAPEEDLEKNPGCVWRALRVVYGRRKGARSWQEHFHGLVTSDLAKEKGFTVQCFAQSPTLYYLEEADGLLELHVDDGHGTGDPVIVRKFLEFLSEHIELKWIDGLKYPGSYEYLKSQRVYDEHGLWILPNRKYLRSALEKYNMRSCNGSTSPKLDKNEEEDDDEVIDDPEEIARFRSATLTLLYLANDRSDITSTVRILCTRLKEPRRGDVRQLKKLLRYTKETENMGIYFGGQKKDDSKVLKVYSDSDWASDRLTRKSTSGAVILANGCRLHTHSRGQPLVALSSCEAEIYAACEALKEGIILQAALEFANMGSYRIELYVDSSSAKQFCLKKGVGRQKHISAKYLWIQEFMSSGGGVMKLIPRTENVADIMTHPPSAKELGEFLPKLGMYVLDAKNHEKMMAEADRHRRTPAVRGARPPAAAGGKSTVMACSGGGARVKMAGMFAMTLVSDVIGQEIAVYGGPGSLSETKQTGVYLERDWPIVTYVLASVFIFGIVCGFVLGGLVMRKYQRSIDCQRNMNCRKNSEGQQDIEKKKNDSKMLTKGDDVYVTNFGVCYHMKGCRMIDGREVMKKRPCKVCFAEAGYT